jgi:hypothetical protein
MLASGHSLPASYFRVVCDKKQVRSFETSFNSVVPFTYKSRDFSSLQPLGVSWLSFRDPNRLFSMVCSLFCQNRGWVYRHPITCGGFKQNGLYFRFLFAIIVAR